MMVNVMLDRRQLEKPSGHSTEPSFELESLRRQLAASRARNLMWRSVIERHLDKGCPSQSLRALLLEAESSDDASAPVA
jgi:hypothetical protein